MSIQIRQLTLNDLPAVQENLTVCLPTPWKNESTGSALSSEVGFSWGLFTEGRLASLMVNYLIESELQVLMVATRPEFRKQGFARELFSFVISSAVELGAGVGHLEVREGNTGAIQFYRGLGFQEVGRRKAYYQDTGEDALLLTLQLGEERRISVHE